MDVTRIEAGFIMNGVDYYSANHCLIEEQKNSPYELGLGWAVQLDREPFVRVRPHSARRRPRGRNELFVGLDVDWAEVEAAFDRFGSAARASGPRLARR